MRPTPTPAKMSCITCDRPLPPNEYPPYFRQAYLTRDPTNPWDIPETLRDEISFLLDDIHALAEVLTEYQTDQTPKQLTLLITSLSEEADRRLNRLAALTIPEEEEAETTNGKEA